ncbi:MAG: hypothetical protein IH998_16620, partial [Proteobacteria bacterium]|nr:hypothetical protein [Pseudomonadota bacterium]
MGGRNKRSVWTIATQPYPEAHFATWPEKLVKPMILAGTSERGVCLECGKQWIRETERELVPTKKAAKTFVYDERDAAGHTTNDQGSNRQRDGHKPGYITAVETTSWQPACNHDAEPVPATVLDPFVGSGTTVKVAREHGRRAIGLDLSLPYLRMAQKRN